MAYEQRKAELESRLSELQIRLESIKRDVVKAHSVDSAEQAQERENDEVLDAIGNETRLSISIIQSALDRMERGTYGLCESCGEEIGAQRLDAVPEATRCLDCADLAEN